MINFVYNLTGHTKQLEVLLLVGERLAEIRKDRGMTQCELAKVLSVSVTAISGYENNRMTPSDDIKIKISRHFNISLDYLVGSIDEELELLNRNTLVLPRNFPDDAKEDVLKYAEYLVYRYTDVVAEKRG